MKRKQIIVLTPVKNEAWILHRFLQVTSIFADHIVIADQHSVDGSRDIYPRYPKVSLVENHNTKYDEAERQLLLIKTARERFGKSNILLAIDADEILAANAMSTQDWTHMLKAEAGTVLYFEKPTFYRSTATAIRYDGGGWPLGYVDDGAQHYPKSIHSTRIPTPAQAEQLYLKDIKFLHYALIRLDAQASKQRMYSALENLKNTKSLRLRRRLYNADLDFTNEGDRQENSKKEWFEEWEKKGIDMHSVSASKYYWYDYELLGMFKRYGTRRFAFEDIWNFNWEEFRLKAIKNKEACAPEKTVIPPPLFMQKMVKWYFLNLDATLLKMKKGINKLPGLSRLKFSSYLVARNQEKTG